MTQSRAGEVPDDCYRLYQAVTFYVNNPQGEAFTLEIEKRDSNFYCDGPREMLVKILDPDEREVAQHEFPDDGVTVSGYQPVHAGWDHELWARASLADVGALPEHRWDVFSKKEKLAAMSAMKETFKVPAGKKGVYQIMCTGCDDHWVQMKLTPNLKYGVLGHPDFLYCTGNKTREGFLYIPRNCVDLQIWLLESDQPRNRELVVFNEDNKVMGRVDATCGKGELLVEAPGKKDVVWKLQASGVNDYAVSVKGLPFILCPDPETAQAIHASQIYLPDGIVVSHLFQKRIWEYLTGLKPSDFDVPIIPLKADEICQNKSLFRIAHLFRSSYVPMQNAYNLLWRQKEALAKIKKPDDIKGYLEAACFPKCDMYGNLAFLYATEFKGNPYFHHPAVLQGVLMGYLMALMDLGEGDLEVFNKSYHGGLYGDAFHLMWRGAEGMHLLKDHVPKEVLAFWEEGLRRKADRMANAENLELVLTNMRSSIPDALYDMYLATGDEKYKTWSLRHAARILTAANGPYTGQALAGYYREHFSFDGGYNSYTAYELGRLYAHSKDKDVLAGLRRGWELMAAMVVPETNGVWTSGNSFASRTTLPLPGDWMDSYLWVADVVPEAGAFARKAIGDPSDNKQWADVIRAGVHACSSKKNLEDMSETAREWCGAAQVRFCDLGPETFASGQLACEAGGTYVKSFGDEIYCVKRPQYYCVVYAAKRAPFFLDKTFGGILGFSGGNILNVWMPDYGSLLLGRINSGYGNRWQDWRHWHVHTFVGTFDDGHVFAGGYSDPVSLLDKDKLLIRGEVNATQIAYQRTYELSPDRIKAGLKVHQSGRMEHCYLGYGAAKLPWPRIKTLYESLPYVFKGKVVFYDDEAKPRGEWGKGSAAKLTDQQWEAADRIEKVKAILIGNEKAGLLMVMDRERVIAGRSAPMKIEGGLQCESLFVELDAETANTTAGMDFGYQLIPLRTIPSENELKTRIQ